MRAQRHEFARLGAEPGANVRQLCRQFGVSPKTGYKWLGRFATEGVVGLEDQSRRPRRSPGRSSDGIEQRVVTLRQRYPDWGGRKLRALLLSDGVEAVPSASTITAILRRHGLLDGPRAGQPAAWQRFEHEAPNQLWQMDFKGDFALVDGQRGRCYPLTVLDDHSRYNLCLRACPNQQEQDGPGCALGRLPPLWPAPALTADNGSPWGNTRSESLTALGAWMVRLGIRLSHSRPYHPQTQGKDERFHRTLKTELLARQSFASLDAAQAAFDRWRERYNLVRPHEALAQRPPVSRYQPSPRPFPEALPAIEYDRGDEVRKVQAQGEISFRGREYLVGRGLAGLPVAVRHSPDEEDAWEVYFCQQLLTRLALARPVEPGSERHQRCMVNRDGNCLI